MAKKRLILKTAMVKRPRPSGRQMIFAQISAAALIRNVDQEKIARFLPCCNLQLSVENIVSGIIGFIQSYDRKYAPAQCPAKVS